MKIRRFCPFYPIPAIFIAVHLSATTIISEKFLTSFFIRYLDFFIVYLGVTTLYFFFIFMAK